MPVRDSLLAFRPRFLAPGLSIFGSVALAAACSGEPSPLFAAQAGALGGAAAMGGSTSSAATGGQPPLGNTGASGNQPVASGGSFSASGGVGSVTGGNSSTGGSRSTGGASALGGAVSSVGGSAAGGAVNSVGGSAAGGSAASGGTGGAGRTGGAGTTGGASPLGVGGNLGGGMGGTNATGGQGNCVPRPEICDGLDNNCVAGTNDEVCPAECIGRSFGGKGYMFCSLRETWGEAVSLCQASAARTLVQVESSAENGFVLGVATELAWLGPWLGASDANHEGDWRWLNDTKFWSGDQNGSQVGGRFSLWAAGNPNNGEAGQNCAALCVQSNALACNSPGVWNDVDCTGTRLGVVCE